MNERRSVRRQQEFISVVNDVPSSAAGEATLAIPTSAYASPQDQFAFAETVFGAPMPLGVRPTLEDLAYFRGRGERFVAPGLQGRARGESRRCFANAYRAVDADASLSYVQGFVRGFAGLIYPHAWCADRNGRLIELTWDCDAASGDEQYFGVRFTRSELAALFVRHGNFDWYEGFSDVVGTAIGARTESGR